MQKPLISISLAYAFGLLLGHGFLYAPWAIILLVIVATLVAGAFVRTGGCSVRQFLIIVLPACIGMAAYFWSTTWLPAGHFTRLFPDDSISHRLIGTITSAIDRDPDKTAFVLDLQEIDGLPVSGRVRVSVREALTKAGYNDRIRVAGKLFEPEAYGNPSSFDYGQFLAQKRIYRMLSVKDAAAIEILQRGSGLFRRIQDWRERIRQAFLSSTTGQGSAILQAMTLGEEGGLTDDMRDRFMAAGVTHIISISGSHLGMVAILCFGLIKTLLHLMPERFYHLLTLHADPKKIAAGLTLPLLVFYTLLAGGQMATVRSLIMLCAALAAIMLDREHALMHALALAGLIILVANPQALFDISFQLSYLSVLAIVSVVMLWNELQLQSQNIYQRLRNSAALLLAVSAGTALATGPLVAHYFNQISLAGLVSNMIVVPLAGFIVVPIGLLSGLVSLATGPLFIAPVNQLVADLFCNIVTFFSRLPFAQFHPPSPGLLWLLIYALFLLAVYDILRTKLFYRFKPFESSDRISKISLMTALFAGLFISASAILFIMPHRTTVLHFPDVGQGDCALIRLASGKNILIDAGGSYDGRFDTGRRLVAPYLWNLGIHRLDLVILSHPHPDHMNGMRYLFKAFAVREVWSHGLDTDLPGYDEFKRRLAEQRIPHRILSAADPATLIGGAEIKVLHPAPDFITHERKAYAAENSRSLVVRVTAQERVFLFVGDINRDAEAVLVQSGRDLSCDLIKVPHHGSNSSNSETFISRAHPAIAIADVGRRNRYRHPSPEVVARYRAAGAQFYQTDLSGALTITLDRERLRVSEWRKVMLQRIDLERPAAWASRERNNWRALWFRAWDA